MAFIQNMQGTRAIRILIVEDHPDACEASRPDIFLADLGLPRGGDGVTLIRRASRLWGTPCKLDDGRDATQPTKDAVSGSRCWCNAKRCTSRCGTPHASN